MYSGHIVVKDLTAKFELLHRGWTPLKAGSPGWPPANGANKSNDDEDEWDYDTMCSSRSDLNTIAAIENVTEIRVCTGT